MQLEIYQFIIYFVISCLILTPYAYGKKKQEQNSAEMIKVIYEFEGVTDDIGDSREDFQQLRLDFHINETTKK